MMDLQMNGVSSIVQMRRSEKAENHVLDALLEESRRAGKRDESANRKPDIGIMSSVQSWVDSLSHDMQYENESPSHCSEECADECEKHCCLEVHHHFGCKSPIEVRERTIFSVDEEMRTQSGSDSTASISSSPNSVRRSNDVVSCGVQIPVTAGRSEGAHDLDVNSINHEGRDGHGSLLQLLKRNWKKRYDLPVNRKGKIVVNGHVLSSAAVKQAEERAGKVHPGSYWYDSSAGFWGVEGGPCRGIIPPSIKQFGHPMVQNCANGDTQVYVNGRELNSVDLAVLFKRGMPQTAGKAYALDMEGVLVDEMTGLEIKNLGKLAPTVERRGKGFGMFAGNVPELTQPVVQGKWIKGSQ